MTDKKIFDRLNNDMDYLKNKGFEVLGVFLQGSQNYHLDYEGSDIDTKAIVLPSFRDFILNKQPVSTTLVLESNEHIDVKDIRLMFDCFKKQNINFIEILFTEYFILNEEYKDIYQPMLDNAEKVAHYNNYAAINCMVGMVLEKRKAMEHPYPTLIDKIGKYGYDPKQLHHILRCREFLIRYIDGVPYRECLIPTHPDDLIRVKRTPPLFTLDEARSLAEANEKCVLGLKEAYMKSNECVVDHDVEKLMSDVLYNALKHNFKKEIND